MKKRLLVLLVGAVLALSVAPAAFADDGASEKTAIAPARASLSMRETLVMQDEVSYQIGQQYSEVVHCGSYNDCKFQLSQRSHIYVTYTTPYSLSGYFTFLVYDSNWSLASGNAEATETSSGLNSYQQNFSCDLNAGTYYLRIRNSDRYGVYLDHTEVEGELIISAEPVVSLARSSISSLSSPGPGKVKVMTSAVKDALSYQYQFSANADFSNSKTFTCPATTYTASGLTRGVYCYARVRPFTTYNDGNAVYGNWSRAQAVYVKKANNVVTVSTSGKTLKFKSLKKKNRAFLIVADDEINSRLTYKLVSVPAKAKKRISLNKSTGKVTVKKGLKKGTYKLKVKVSAASTASYYGASATKTITLRVK